MKRMIFIAAAACMLLVGCAAPAEGQDTAAPGAAGPAPAQSESTAAPEQVGQTVAPLPDNTMDQLNDGIFSVSLEAGDAYVDDTGKMQMDLLIYTYDRYDAVEIANLKAGDRISGHAGEIAVTSVEQTQTGTVLINGGLDQGGMDLVSEGGGVYHETGMNDAKSWYQVGEATIRVSTEFEGTDNADPELGEVILYPGSFLTDEVTNYDFTPYNTTIRVEDGQIVELNRHYIP